MLGLGQFPRLRRVRGALPLVMLVGLGLVGCKTPSEKPGEEADAKGTEAQSPNASILPAPLPATGAAEGEAGVGGAVGDAARGAKVPKRLGKPPTALPIARALPQEARPIGTAAGWVAKARFGWGGLRESITVDGELHALQPELEISMLSGRRDDPARVRMQLSSRTFPLPIGTELRGREDALGMLVVWPDGRSYRVVSHGAMQTLFEERRVDRMPAVPVEVQRKGEGEALGRPTQSYAISASTGSMEMELAEVREVGGAGPILCRFLLSLLRVGPRLAPCRAGVLPVRAQYQLAGGGTLEFRMSELRYSAELAAPRFAMPPVLPIFKPGELPPLESSLWEGRHLKKMMPPGDGKAVLALSNHYDLPIYLIVEGVPSLLVMPGQSVTWALEPREYRYRARDFFGNLLVPVDAFTPPAEVALGLPVATEESPTEASETPPKPSVE